MVVAPSPVTGVWHCELFAAAGGDAAPGPGPGSGSGPGLCRAERKHPDRKEPMPQEQRWQDNERTAYLSEFQEEKKNMEDEPEAGDVNTTGMKEENKVPTVCWSGIFCWSWSWSWFWACLWSWFSECCSFEA